ncbi:hypothetical protein B0H15DRAFT_867287 [Mycena belliarum]|uniref:Uncharacterized protein n=1 Tax=Mycena belliarum TaxID=1033014 RepID=A0AAD6XMC2_9AGAR|nr:hypothetical protein B0H15DRAFT_867287 [Mycena belliae]
MAAATSASPGPPAQPAFPEDIERIINDMLLSDAREMSGTMSLVAPRFHAWTRPATYRTIVIRRCDDWIHCVKEFLLPNAGLIRCLAIPLTLSDEEHDPIRALLNATHGVEHLAVSWTLWTQLPKECGALRLASLYLSWDLAAAAAPTLAHLQHPTLLTDLAIYAPPVLNNLTPFHPATLYVPDLAHCTRLSYVTYAAKAYPVIGRTVGNLCEEVPDLRGAMFVWVNIPEACLREESTETMWIEGDLEDYAQFSMAHLEHAHQLLGEWIAKVEGRTSALTHPPPHNLSNISNVWSTL